MAGHAAAYAVVGTSRRDALVHGYLSYAPQFVAVCLACVATALALRVGGRLQGRPSAWPFALVPPAAFAAQELIERLAAGLPAQAVLEPAVVIGLVAQLPIALLGFLVARALLRAADEVALAFLPEPVLASPVRVDRGDVSSLVSLAPPATRRGRAPPR